MYFSASVAVSPKCRLFSLWYRVVMLRWAVSALDPAACTCWWKVTTMSSWESSALVTVWFWSSFNMWGLKKRQFSSAYPERRWRPAMVLGSGVWRTSHSWDKLVFCLNKSGLEAGSSPLRIDGGKGTKKIRDLPSLHQVQIRLPQTGSALLTFCVTNRLLTLPCNSNSTTLSGKCIAP